MIALYSGPTTMAPTMRIWELVKMPTAPKPPPTMTTRCARVSLIFHLLISGPGAAGNARGRCGSGSGLGHQLADEPVRPLVLGVGGVLDAGVEFRAVVEHPAGVGERQCCLVVKSSRRPQARRQILQVGSRDCRYSSRRRSFLRSASRLAGMMAAA
jgi:hypothetical protein